MSYLPVAGERVATAAAIRGVRRPPLFYAAIANEATKRALAAIGSWSDLDWEEMEAALDRIRHESRPTPPIDLDL